MRPGTKKRRRCHGDCGRYGTHPMELSTGDGKVIVVYFCSTCASAKIPTFER